MYEYIIDIPIDGSSKNSVIKLSKLLSKHNSIYSDIYNNYKNKKNVVHFTLKYWFTIDENKKINIFDKLEKLVKNTKVFKIKIDKLKTFDDDNQFVVYANVNRGKEGNKFVKKFMKILRSDKTVTWKKMDDKINGAIPHSSIAIVKKPADINLNNITKLLKSKLKKTESKVIGIRIRRRPINTITNEKGEKELYKFYKFKN